MSVFISYARSDESVVQELARDIARTKHEVWIDQQLTGGQSWWDTILAEIVRCDLFVIALSPGSVKSKACGLELGYAIALRKTILPVMVREVEIALAPDIVANSQVIRYTARTADAVLDLANALASTPPSPPLPASMPIPPTVPMTYLGELQRRVIAPALAPTEQHALAGELRVHALVDETRTGALQLLRDLRRRPDIIEAVGRDVDNLLERFEPRPPPRDGATPTPTPTPATTTAPATALALATAPAPALAPAPAGGWYPDPYGRFEMRYHDGSAWTDRVTSRGHTYVDSPLPSPRFVAATGPVAPFSAGAFAGLLVASFCCFGLVGLLVGVINLKEPSRRSQAISLLVVGGIVAIVWFMAFIASIPEPTPAPY